MPTDPFPDKPATRELKEILMPSRNANAVLSVSLNHLPCMLEEADAGKHCVRAAAILCEVCSYFDIPAEARACRAIFANAAWVARRDRGELPRAETAEHEYASDGAWAVGIGGASRQLPGHFNGHIVVVVGDAWVLDVTCPQVSRPERGIPLEASLYPCLPGFLLGDQGQVYNNPETGVTAIYQSLANDGWKTTRSWTDAQLRAGFVSEIIDLVKITLEEEGF